MAANLLAARHEVVVHSRSPRPVDALVAKGAARAFDAADVGSRCDVVVTALPDSAAVEEVVLDAGGLFSAAPAGLLLVDTSTIAPETARAVDVRARELGLRSLDAPVSGGERAAIDGTLSIMVGGAAEDVTAAGPVLATLGRTIVHAGPAGAGQIVKAANQMIVAGTIALVAEAIVLLQRSGLDAATAIPVLAGGLAGNRILDTRASDMLAGRFAPGARVDLHHKDLGIALATAREAGVWTPMSAVSAQLFTALRGLGRGSLDHTAVLTLIDELSGGRPDG